MKFKSLFVFGKSFMYYKLRSKSIGYPKVLSTEKSINYLLNHPNISLARIGDGEIRWASGIENGSGFQSNDEKLAKELTEVMTHHNSNLKLAVPDVFSNAEKKYTLGNALAWIVFLVRYREQWVKLISKEYQYLDANLSRLYIDRKNKKRSPKLFSLLQQLWEGKNILTVEGAFTLLGYKNELFDNAKSISRVVVPAKDAYSIVDDIEESVRQLIDSGQVDVVLLSVGPTATVLADRLANTRIPVYDVGHFDIEFEWMKMGVNKRTRIPAKYVNEIDIAEKSKGKENSAELKGIMDTPLKKQVIKQFV
ncbi:GT-D fold domain-containing glycosyltransferase [Leuconostoc falkenbergense]|uniref:GT-D fold domain-containing glycosyltransferase n=1 Tax=Leuconostoc falkenbergense TaxID=2766470 RepID=UPI0028A7B49A|nr:GT-D fold domain-containing glycosyltransferase [Leuconostoc falkenbergense]